VGIGTSSPSFKQHTVVAGATGDIAGFSLSGNTSNPTLLIKADATNQVITFRGGSSTSTYPAIAFDTGTGGEKMRLDSAGNLGLGVTPSAWSVGKAIEVGNVGNAFWGVSATQISITQNAYFDGSWKYAANGYATRFQEDSGAYIWNTSPNNTSGAGAGITFTAAMTLDASGNLLVGTTSASSITGWSGGAVGQTIQSAQPVLAIVDSDDTTNFVTWLANSGGTTYLYGKGTYPLIFGTNNTERARIDSSGNLLVGTASLPAANRVKGFAALSNSTGGIQVYQTANNSDWAVTSTSGNVINFYSDSGSALVYSGSIAVNGVVTTYGSVSDYRLKENVEPMQNALAKVLQLKPVTFAFKNSGQNSQGFIAHELQQVCPDAVIGEKDAIDSEGKPQYQGIDTSFLVATLTAALQELNAKFDAYVASHP
jgi:hypothetical protein